LLCHKLHFHSFIQYGRILTMCKILRKNVVLLTQTFLSCTLTFTCFQFNFLQLSPDKRTRPAEDNRYERKSYHFRCRPGTNSTKLWARIVIKYNLHKMLKNSVRKMSLNGMKLAFKADHLV
jgi:hypothetical protein